MTQPIHGGGWGKQSWGGWGWGGFEFTPGTAFAVIGAFAPSENIVRMIFTQLPYYSEIFDQYDASDVTHYTVAPVSGTVGRDGYAARAVTPVQALISTAQPNALDIYLDRPMSPYPAQYVLTYQGLASSSLSTTLAPGQFQFFAVFRKLQPQSEDVVLPTADFANPQTASSIQGSGVGSTLGPMATLGVLQPDDSGDYAFDAGIQSVKKRILRRGVTKKGAFAHLPANYGVGLLDAAKALGGSTIRNKMAADYQSQILLEPEVVSASVSAIPDPQSPQLVHFVILAKTRAGTTVSMDHPVNVITGVSLAQLGS